MKRYELELEEYLVDTSLAFNDTLNELDPYDSNLEPVAPSIHDLVDLFLEYRKKVGRRNSSS